MALLAWLFAIASVPEIRVTVLPVDAAAVSCTAHDSAGTAAGGRLAAGDLANRWLWRPASPGDRLSCAAPGFEPADLVPTASAPGGLTLRLEPARPITLLAEGPESPATLEWLALEQDRTVARARRTLNLRGALAVPVSVQRRVLRVRRAGASPVSFYLPEHATTTALAVPPPRPGGEIWGLLPSHRYLPETLELHAGSRVSVIQADAHGAFQAPGLAPGSYALVPVFRGGARGARVELVVNAQQTTEALLRHMPETGGARVRIEAPLCGEDGLTLELSRAGDATAPPALSREIPGSQCDVELHGLAEGPWVAALTRGAAGGSPEASADFTVVKGESADVTLEASARAAGRVSAGGQPAPGLHLVFELGPRSWRVQTDPEGNYAIGLGAPGEYQVSARAAEGLPSRTFVRTLHAGEQQEDFELGEAAISVRVRSEDSAAVAETVSLSLASSDGPRMTGTFQPEQEDVARFVGLEFGEYSVSATTPSGLASQELARVELTPQNPAAEVELVLARARGVLRVFDPTGVPLGGARASAGSMPLREQSRGVFRLDSVAVGDRLMVNAPGYVPVCRVLQAADRPELRLGLQSAGEILTLQFHPDVAWQAAVFTGLPGSDCPVPLDEAEPRIRADAQGITVEVRMPSGAFGLVVGRLAHRVVVPGSASIPP